jgi:hypothetical protein
VPDKVIFKNTSNPVLNQETSLSAQSIAQKKGPLLLEAGLFLILFKKKLKSPPPG